MRSLLVLLAVLLLISACSGVNHAARKPSGLPTATPTHSLQSVQWGLIVQGNHHQGALARQLQTDSALLHHRAQVVGSYQVWNCPGGYGKWNFGNWVTAALAAGRTPQISWYPNPPSEPACGTSINDIQIAAGAYDSYIQSWAHGAASLPGKPTIYIRLFEEFDGAPGTSSYGPAMVAAWRHIVNIFRADGATNVQFIWDPHASIATRWTQAQAASMYPGNRYVNDVGWDQYGDANVAAAYKLMHTLAPAKPIIVPEFGGTDRSDVALKALLNGITSGQFPAITQVDYFDDNVGPDRDFTLAANPKVAAFIKFALAKPTFERRLPIEDCPLCQPSVRHPALQKH